MNSPRSLTVAAVQTSPVFGRVDANLDAALALVPGGCDLAVLPELFASGYQFRSRAEAASFAEDLAPDAASGPVTTRLAAHAAATGTTLVAGLVEREGANEGLRLFNSALLVRPDGTRDVYRKVHLFMDEKLLFDPGDRPFPVFAACGTKVGLMICFDWIFPEAARSLALGGARVIAHPCNLVLPWCQEAMVTRCLENAVHAVTANRVGCENRTGNELAFSGGSQVVAPRGERLARLPSTGTGAAVARIAPGVPGTQVTLRNDLLADRRPGLYRG
jgi:predicted amidohydrolase